MRAGNGLALEKFFSSAFGNIFESGVLMDPEFDLPADQSGNGNPSNGNVVTSWSYYAGNTSNYFRWSLIDGLGPSYLSRA